MLKIGEFSKLSLVSVRMLRRYDEMGLLVPDHVDAFTGYRYYREDQLFEAAHIVSLRDMGFKVEAIRGMLALWDNRDAVLARLCEREQEEARAHALAANRLSMLQTAKRRIGKGELMKYSVVLKTIKERTVASVRGILSRYEEEGRLWHTLMQETADMNIEDDDPCISCAVFHDAEHNDSDVDVEVQRAVRGRYPDTEHVRFMQIAPIQVASSTFKGDYAQTAEVCATVANWISGNGYAYDGPMFFIYHVSPHETQNPQDYVTEVCFPVRKS